MSGPTEEELITGIKLGKLSLEDIPSKYRTYKVCLAGCGKSFRTTPDRYKREDLCLKALCINQQNIKYIPERYKTREFYLKAMKLVRCTEIGYICNRITSDITTYDFYLEIAKHNTILIHDVPQKYRKFELFFELAKNNKNRLKTKYISHHIPEKYLFRYNPIMIYLRSSELTPFSFQCKEKILLGTFGGFYPGYEYKQYIKDSIFIREYTKIFLFIKN